MEDGDVLFIDEIHRLSPVVEEILYPAMEDRALDIMIGEGPSARSVRIAGRLQSRDARVRLTLTRGGQTQRIGEARVIEGADRHPAG